MGGGKGSRWRLGKVRSQLSPGRHLESFLSNGGDTHLRIKLTRGIIRSNIELVMILVVCYLSKGHNSVSNIKVVCVLSNKAAPLYNVWLKYLQPDKGYGPDTISIQKNNKGCNSDKMESE